MSGREQLMKWCGALQPQISPLRCEMTKGIKRDDKRGKAG